MWSNMPSRKLLLPRFKNPTDRRRSTPRKKTQYPNSSFKIEPHRGGAVVTLENNSVANLYTHSARGFFHDPHAPKRAHVLEVASFSPGEKTPNRSRVSRGALHFLLDPRTMQHFIQRGIVGYVGYTKNPEIIRFFQKQGGYTSTLPVSSGQDNFVEAFFNLRLQQGKRDPSDARHPTTFIFLPFPNTMTGMDPHVLLNMINSLNRAANRAREKHAQRRSGATLP